MERRKFLENSCLVCLGIAVGGVSLNSCSNIKTVNSFENKGYLEIDKSEFIDSQTKEEYSNIIVTSNSLKKPLILFKTGTDNYEAVSLECTHKGVKLDLINNRLECSEHGSVFEKNGTVIKGPAKNNLKRYNIDKTLTIIKIEL